MREYEFESQYTLEQHLKAICEVDEQYIDLYSTWKLNKKTLKQILKTIVINYPHFTEHDYNHSNTIINNIEMLLGVDRIKLLSATDTWMILQCSYLHDFGMAILYKKVEEIWGSPEFIEYIEYKKSFDSDIKEAAEYIETIGEKIPNSNAEKIWPLKIKKYVTRIIGDYFRAEHSALTKEYLNTLLNEWNIDLSHNNLIKNRLLKSIAEISFLHTQNFEEVMKLDFKSNGFRTDYFHPRFIAEMLRMGDLLDLDNGRYNNYVKNVIGDIPKFSEVHIEKHNSITQLLITPKLIEVKADCKETNVYKETRNWFNWLEDEIKNLTLNWIEIIPNNMTGYAPKFKKAIYYKGDKDFTELVDLRFNISQEKAFDIIEGSGIYNDEFVFMREFIQNALDATKIQLWRDIKSGTYDSWITEGIPLKMLSPFDIDKNIFNNYKINIEVKLKENKNIEVIIKDKGTGISLDSLKSMSDVGQNDKTMKNEISEMPDWLRPTGGFGIGIQSGFLISEQFSAYSKSDSNDSTFEIIFESRKKNGYIQVIKSSYDMKRGTEFHIQIKRDNFKFSYGGYVDKYISSNYDPIVNDDLLAYKILDSAQIYCQNKFIPVTISYDENHINLTQDNKYIDIFKNECTEKYDKDSNRYLYKVDNDLMKIHIWDTKTSSYIMFKINYSAEKWRLDLKYKGITIEKNKLNNNIPWIYGCIDVYGYDTKKILKLNRNELTTYGLEIADKIYSEALEFYINVIKCELMKDTVISKEKSEIVLFYFLIGQRFGIDVDKEKCKEAIKDTKYELKVIKKSNDTFKIENENIKNIINMYPNLTYVNIGDFAKYETYKESYREDIIEDILNKNKEQINDELIIIDKNFIQNILEGYRIGYIQYINNNDKQKLIIYRSNMNNKKIAINTDEYTRKEFIKMLVYKKEQLPQYIGFNQQERQRSCIPAISEYSDLIVDCVPFGICVIQRASNYIISPITLNQSKNIEIYKNKNDFINSITQGDDYKKLIDFVYENKLEDNSKSKDQIDKLYRNLLEEYYDIENNISI